MGGSGRRCSFMFAVVEGPTIEVTLCVKLGFCSICCDLLGKLVLEKIARPSGEGLQVSLCEARSACVLRKELIEQSIQQDCCLWCPRMGPGQRSFSLRSVPTPTGNDLDLLSDLRLYITCRSGVLAPHLVGSLCPFALGLVHYINPTIGHA